MTVKRGGYSDVEVAAARAHAAAGYTVPLAAREMGRSYSYLYGLARHHRIVFPRKYLVKGSACTTHATGRTTHRADGRSKTPAEQHWRAMKTQHRW